MSPQVEEQLQPGETACEASQRFSLLKAQEVARHVGEGIVVAADTVVAYEGQILGKPRDAGHACAMLRRLRGARHMVLSGTTVMHVAKKQHITRVCESEVWMRDMEDAEIQAYVASGDPMDKAAAYAIQNSAFAPVERVVGCPANVMGLPLCHIVQDLKSLGVVLPDSPPAHCETKEGYVCALAGEVIPHIT